jgi:hypothetical protein
MKLADVMDELSAKLEIFHKLNVFAYPVDTITPPGGVVGYPEQIEYDTTYGRGVDMFRGIQLFMVAGRISTLQARNDVSEWTAGRGPRSVKQFLDGSDYNSCDDVCVTSATFDTFSIADVDYIVAVFSIDVSGPGEY